MKAVNPKRFAAFSFVGEETMKKITFIPEKYQDTLFLTAEDIKEIFRLGENKTYEYLKTAPFKVEKIGNQIRVNAKSFWEWYDADKKTA